MPSTGTRIVRPSRKVKILSAVAYEASEKKVGGNVKSLRPAARGGARPEVRWWLSRAPRQQAHKGHHVSTCLWLPYLSTTTKKHPGRPQKDLFLLPLNPGGPHSILESEAEYRQNRES